MLLLVVYKCIKIMQNLLCLVDLQYPNSHQLSPVKNGPDKKDNLLLILHSIIIFFHLFLLGESIAHLNQNANEFRQSSSKEIKDDAGWMVSKVSVTHLYRCMFQHKDSIHVFDRVEVFILPKEIMLPMFTHSLHASERNKGL